MSIQGFVLEQAENGHYWVAIDDESNLVATSIEDARETLESCLESIALIQEQQVSFILEEREWQWGWAVLHEDHRLASSFETWPTEEEAAGAMEMVQEGVADAPILNLPDLGTLPADDPTTLPELIPVIFTVAPSPARWGQRLTLTRVAGDFGTQREIQLSQQTPLAPLTILEWGTETIAARLPADPPAGDGVYTVNFAEPAGVAQELTISSQFELRIATPVAWGAQLTAVAVDSSFGSAPGTVRLISAQTPHELTPEWTPQQIQVRLPESAPFFAPAYQLVIAKPSGASAAQPLALQAPDLKHALREQLKKLRLPAVNVTLRVPNLTLPLAIEGFDALPSTLLGVPLAKNQVWGGWPEHDPAKVKRLDVPGKANGADLAFAPPPCRVGQRAPLSYRVWVDITLSASGIEEFVQLSVDVTVEALPVPTLLALYEHPDYKGNALWMAPHGPPERHEMIIAVDTLLGELHAVAALFDSIFWLTGVRDTIGLLTKVVQIMSDRRKTYYVAGTSFIPYLEDYRYTWFQTAEDIVSSAFLLGLPGDFANLYGARAWDSREGVMKLETGPARLVAFVGQVARDNIVSSVAMAPLPAAGQIPRLIEELRKRIPGAPS